MPKPASPVFHSTLQPPAEGGSAPSAAEQLRCKLMRQSLSALLDQVSASRHVLPHLAALERGLARNGTGVIAGISAPVLTKICSQLSSLPLPEADRPLQELLCSLMDALESRRPPDNQLSDFVTFDKLSVEEVGQTDFDAASMEQATTRPSRL